MVAEWIQAYGLWAIFIGGMLEGEAVFIAAGYAISQGYLHPTATFLVATLGASLGDHTFYLLGRLHGAKLLHRLPKVRLLRARANRFLRRWGRLAAFMTRFAYGLRAVIPLSIGMARFPVLLFVAFNLLGALAFALVYLMAGYFFGEALEALLVTLRRIEIWIFLGILIAGGLTWLCREWRIWSAPEPGGAAGPKQTEGPRCPTGDEHP